MNNKNTCINNITLTGVVHTAPVLNNTHNGVNYYNFMLRCDRESKTYDILPITINDRDADKLALIVPGKTITIHGAFRSHNHHDENNISHTYMYVYVKDLYQVDDNATHTNEVRLIGYLTKKPNLRVTGINKTPISDIIAAIHRDNGKSDYAICIAWGKTANLSAKLHAGDHVRIIGRFQSRSYTKKLPEDKIESRTAYEISIGYMGLCPKKANLKDILTMDIHNFTKNTKE